MKLTVSTTNQPAPKLACPVTLNGKMFVVTKCSDSDTGPPLQSLASDSLAHKIAHSFMVPKQQRQQPANQPTLGEDAGFSQRGGEHCLAPGNNTGIRGLLPSINEVVALDTVA